MKSYTVKLQTINEVNDFVNTLLLIKEDVDLTSERYVVNAKSIMGVFSLDLTKPHSQQLFTVMTMKDMKVSFQSLSLNNSAIFERTKHNVYKRKIK